MQLSFQSLNNSFNIAPSAPSNSPFVPFVNVLLNRTPLNDDLLKSQPALHETITSPFFREQTHEQTPKCLLKFCKKKHQR